MTDSKELLFQVAAQVEIIRAPHKRIQKQISHWYKETG